jgi:hypothetical protein
MNSAFEHALTLGGDARLILDGDGRNAFGWGPHPESLMPSFGSCTASGISTDAYAAAAELHARLESGADPLLEADRLRNELAARLDLPAGAEVIFSASGTDAHLLAARYCATPGGLPPIAVGVEARETGSGVPAALAGRHYGHWSPLAGAVTAASPLGCVAFEKTELPLRDALGRPLSPDERDGRFSSAVETALAAGRACLLVTADVSKSGLLAPAPDLAAALLRRRAGGLKVLVDACQCRLAPQSVRAYLEAGFWVALTGSKAMTGPAFAGALLMGAADARRLREIAPAPGFAAYSARADWPQGWAPRAVLPHSANVGLLLRWRAALKELEAFQALPPDSVDAFLERFSQGVDAALAANPDFLPLETPAPRRGSFDGKSAWDRSSTIHAFGLRRRGKPLDADGTGELLKRLKSEGFHLGQAFRWGGPDGPLGALRLCSSMRLVRESLGPGGGGPEGALQTARNALEAALRLS